MLADTIRDIPCGKLEGPETNESILAIVAIVESCLAEFSKTPASAEIKNEKGLTQNLCRILNCFVHINGHPFHFEKEYMEDDKRGDSPTVDIGVFSMEVAGIIIHSKSYSNRKSFFSMEAKRLDNISRPRQKEYLVGRFENGKFKDCGGVERFKKEIHGKGLFYGAMIGYVQKYSFDYWRVTINAWIDELISQIIDSDISWFQQDKLIETRRTSETIQFQSNNSRLSDSIYLYHLWVNLVNENS